MTWSGKMGSRGWEGLKHSVGSVNISVFRFLTLSNPISQVNSLILEEVACQNTLPLLLAASAVTTCIRVSVKRVQAHDSSTQWYLIAKHVCTYMPGFPLENFEKKKEFQTLEHWGLLIFGLDGDNLWRASFYSAPGPIRFDLKGGAGSLQD